MTPARKRFYRIYNKALSDGRLVPSDSCDLCGHKPGRARQGKHRHKTSGIAGHHLSYRYGRELDVRWLCKECHTHADYARRNRISWDVMMVTSVPRLQEAGLLRVRAFADREERDR